MSLLLRAAALLCLPVLLLSTASPLRAQDHLASGQNLYVPVYSHIYAGDQEKPQYLTATLSLRNTDPKSRITFTRADYYDQSGTLIRAYIERPVELTPLSSTRFVVKESDTAGGSGASFLVQWEATEPVSPPIVESVMIGTRGQQGISFTSRAQVLQGR